MNDAERAEYVRTVVDAAPPLTARQRATLALIFRTARPDVAAFLAARESRTTGTGRAKTRRS